MTHDNASTDGSASHPSATPGGKGVRVIQNAAAAHRDDPCLGPLTAAGFHEALAEISTWPGYAPTPLVALPALAASLGLGEIHYKDEAGRFGLGSFKPIGGAYAVARALCRALAQRGIDGVTPSDLRAGRHREAVAAITLISATDGNHGRAVAWAARLFGAKAKIFSHDQMSEGRRAAIRALGAKLVICEGGYDDSVREAFAAGEREVAPVVQDTSAGDYREVPIDITHGYGVIAQEVHRALPAPPTHAIVQAGVGGVASAVAGVFWQHYGPNRPRFIVLEPTNAACVAQSIEAGRRVVVEGDTHTAMAGLACGEVSEVAWEVLATAADAAIVIDDDWAFAGMRRLADPVPPDPAIIAGECAGGAVGALLALAERPDLRAVLHLDATSRVLLVGTEGATDPAIYEAVVGRPPSAVAA